MRVAPRPETAAAQTDRLFREEQALAGERTLLDNPTALVPDEVVESWKRLIGSVAKFRRLSQQVEKATQRWDFRLLRQRVPEVALAAADVEAAARSAEAALATWNTTDASSAVSGYAEEIERAAAQLRLPLQGEFPDYEAFPLKVTVDLLNEQVTISRRKTTTLEPTALMREVQARHQALHRSSFNARRFMHALVEAYDLLKEAGRAKLMDVSLLAIYDMLTLRSGTGDYTKAEFAFDIYRLRRESDMLYDGRQLSFLNGRKGNIPVPSAKGGVDLLGILRLVEVAGSD